MFIEPSVVETEGVIVLFRLSVIFFYFPNYQDMNLSYFSSNYLNFYLCLTYIANCCFAP